MDTPSTSKTISFTVTYRGTTHPFYQPLDCSLVDFQTQLEQLSGVPPPLQKLLYKGKKTTPGNVTLSLAGFKNGMKIQMLGVTTQELDRMKVVEDEQRRRERIMREKALKASVKAQPTGTGGKSVLALSSLATPYRFHEIKPLEHLPGPSAARDYLNKLSDDPAIQHVMQKHKFTVGELTELAPHEHPKLLGVNVNKGEQIKLRIRTDLYDGFRFYKDVRRVLCHELAHNVWGDHDNNFKELNSLLNREVVEFERSASVGWSPDDIYMPPSEVEADAQDSLEGDRQEKVLETTLNVNQLGKVKDRPENCCETSKTGFKKLWTRILRRFSPRCRHA